MSEKNGFTLIELIITIFLVSVGLIGILTFFNSSLQSQFDAKNEVIAAGLAQEGPELMRNKAEYHKLNDGADWNTIKTKLLACSRIDYRSLTGAHSCQTGDYVCLSGDQRYQQCGSDPGTGIKRILTVIDNGVNGLYIKSEVTWNGYTTKAEDILYENSY